MAHRKKLANLNLKIDAELKEKLKTKCEQDETSITTVLEDAIRAYLGENDTDNDSSTDINNDTNNDINTEQLEQRLQRLEGALEGLTCEINPNQLQQKLENQLYETQCRLNQLEDSVVNSDKLQKQHKEDIRDLKNDIQSIKVNRVQRHEFYDLQEKVGSLERDRQHKSSKKGTGKKQQYSETIGSLEKMVERLAHNDEEKKQIRNNIQNKQKDDLIYFNGEKWRIKRKDRGGYSFGKLD